MCFHARELPVTCADGQTRPLGEVLRVGQVAMIEAKPFPPGHAITAATPTAPVWLVLHHPDGFWNHLPLREHADNLRILTTAHKTSPWYPVQSFPDLDQARAYSLERKQKAKEARKSTPPVNPQHKATA